MSIHRTCAFSHSPIEEGGDVFAVYIANKNLPTRSCQDAFSSSDYTRAWDNFNIVGFPIAGVYESHSDFRSEYQASELILLSIINDGTVKQYRSLSEVNKDIFTGKMSTNEKSVFKNLTMFFVSKDVYKLLTSRKRSRQQLEYIFNIPDHHDDNEISYQESLIEHKNILSTAKEKTTLLFNERFGFHDEDDDEKIRLRMFKHTLKSLYNDLPYIGKSLYDIALEGTEDSNLLSLHLTNLCWLVFSFDDFRKHLAPTLHSYENRNYSELSNFYQQLSDVILEKESHEDNVPYVKIKSINRYKMSKTDFFSTLEDYDEEYQKEVVTLLEKYKLTDGTYYIETSLISKDDFNTLFNGDLFSHAFKNSILVII